MFIFFDIVFLHSVHHFCNCFRALTNHSDELWIPSFSLISACVYPSIACILNTVLHRAGNSEIHSIKSSAEIFQKQNVRMFLPQQYTYPPTQLESFSYFQSDIKRHVYNIAVSILLKNLLPDKVKSGKNDKSILQDILAASTLPITNTYDSIAERISHTTFLPMLHLLATGIYPFPSPDSLLVYYMMEK